MTINQTVDMANAAAEASIADHALKYGKPTEI